MVNLAFPTQSFFVKNKHNFNFCNKNTMTRFIGVVNKVGSGYTDFSIINGGTVRIYGTVPVVHFGRLLVYTLETRTSQAGYHYYISCTRRALDLDRMFFNNLLTILHEKIPNIAIAAVKAMFDKYFTSPNPAMYYADKLKRYMHAWSAQVPDLRVWMRVQAYEFVYPYYDNDCIFNASVEEIEFLEGVIKSRDFLGLALCGSGRAGWRTRTLPMTPSDVFKADPNLDQLTMSLLSEAEPWFADPSFCPVVSAVRIDIALVACGFLVEVGGHMYRAAFYNKLKTLRERLPHGEVCATGMEMLEKINGLWEKSVELAKPTLNVLRAPGVIYDSRTLDHVKSCGYSIESSTCFLNLPYNGGDVVAYNADQWKVSDLVALYDHMGPTGTLTLVGTGQYKNAAGYNVVRVFFFVSRRSAVSLLLLLFFFCSCILCTQTFRRRASA